MGLFSGQLQTQQSRFVSSLVFFLHFLLFSFSLLLSKYHPITPQLEKVICLSAQYAINCFLKYLFVIWFLRLVGLLCMFKPKEGKESLWLVSKKFIVRSFRIFTIYDPLVLNDYMHGRQKLYLLTMMSMAADRWFSIFFLSWKRTNFLFTYIFNSMSCEPLPPHTFHLNVSLIGKT